MVFDSAGLQAANSPKRFLRLTGRARIYEAVILLTGYRSRALGIHLFPKGKGSSPFLRRHQLHYIARRKLFEAFGGASPMRMKDEKGTRSPAVALCVRKGTASLMSLSDSDLILNFCGRAQTCYQHCLVSVTSTIRESARFVSCIPLNPRNLC